MPGRNLGEVFIVVSPETKLFRTQADVQIRKALAGLNPNVRIGVDTKAGIAAVAAFQARIKALNTALSSMRADIKDDKGAESKIAGLQARVLGLVKQMESMTMAADTKKLDAQIAGEVARLKGLQQQMSRLQMDADDKKAAAKIASLEAEAFHLQKSLDEGKLKANVDIKKAEARLLQIDAELRVLNDNAQKIKLAADNRSLLRQIDVVISRIAGLKAQAKDIKLGAEIDPAKLLASEAALLGIEHIVQDLGSKDVPGVSTAMGAFFSSMNRGSTAAAYGWKVLTGHVTLFGGVFNKLLPAMFTSVAVWHLLIDAAIEVVAVWAPAIVAVTAFGLAGKDAAIEVYNRMKAVNTVMDATHQAVAPLGNQFNQLAARVRPEVYQLFGDALLVMSKRSGAFNTVAIETGRVLDRLAARFVFAVTNGSSVNKFMEHAVSDVAKLGDSFANLGGIFGAVFRAVPGYAEILLSVGDAILHVISVAVQAGEPIIAVGLALHGFFIYGGLAVTMSLALVAGVVKLIGAFGKFNEAVTLVGLNSLKAFGLQVFQGIKWLIGYSGALLSLAASEGVAAAGTIALADAQTLLSRVPTIFWITLAATAIAGLVIWLRSAHSATQDFVSGLNQTVQAASLAQVLTTIQGAQIQVTNRLAAAQKTLAGTTQYIASQNLHTGQSTQMVSQAWLQAKGNADALRGAQQQLAGQYQLVQGRLGGLSKEYGGQTQALGALNAAGITTSQILDKNSQHWALALIQVEATAAAYKAMGTQAGVLGNDLDVLGRTVTDQYQATQKLNQAWSTFISDVTSTQGSFDTVAQGFSTLNDHTGTLKLSLGKLKVSYADNKAAIDSLTPAGIALNQAFTDQIGNVDKLFASWRTAGLASNLFTQGVKAAIAPLLKYAGGSQEATAQLVALAQEAGYQGPISMAALTKWLGNTHGATQKLKDITNQATVQEALLTGAMQDQGNYIANTLIKDINNAILKYNGVEQAAAAYGDAVAKSGRQSDAAKAARTTLINDLIKSGLAAGDSTTQIAAMISKVLGIPPKAAMQIVLSGTGGMKVTTKSVGGGAFAGKLVAISRLASGGLIRMGTGPTADDVPAMLSRGEYVHQAAAVSKYGVPAMRAVNEGRATIGYAGGGLVETGNRQVLTGDAAVAGAQSFYKQTANAALEVAAAVVNEQITAALAGSGPAVLQYAMSFLHKVPYVWGGSTPSGWDCSGYVSYVYDHFKLFNGRTDAAGLQSWARPSAPTPGGMAFYGTPAHHVGFVVNSNTLLSALGHAFGTTLSSLNMGDNSGYGIPPQGFGNAGNPAGVGGSLPKGKLQELAFSLLNQYGWGNQWDAFNALENREAGWSMTATNPSSKAYGLAQMDVPPGGNLAANKAKYFAYGGNWSTAIGQLTAMLNYIAQIYGGPDAAWAHEVRAGWYSKGGPARKLAAGGFAGDPLMVTRDLLGQLTPGLPPGPAELTGGQIRARTAKQHHTAFRKLLAGEQAHEIADYTGLRHAFLSGPRKYLTKTTVSELATLAKRQAAEQLAYAHLAGPGLTRTHLSQLGSATRAEHRTAMDKALNRHPGGHPGWAHGLEYWLGRLGTASKIPVFDRGGVLRPGPNLTWNNTGRPEHLVPAGSGEVHIHVHNHGVVGSRMELENWLVKSVDIARRKGRI